MRYAGDISRDIQRRTRRRKGDDCYAQRDPHDKKWKPAPGEAEREEKAPGEAEREEKAPG